MPAKQWEMTLLFEQFVQDTYRGKRLKKDGKRIKPQTADNYRYVLLLLQEYEAVKAISIRIKEVSGRNKGEWIGEQKYWNRFYLQFTNFLYGDKHCFDNYVGNVVKIIRIFFHYLKSDKLLQTGDFYKRFYIYREEIPVHTLLPEQLKFLITNEAFHHNACRKSAGMAALLQPVNAAASF